MPNSGNGLGSLSPSRAADRMATVRFAPSARADMLEIFDFIARDKPIAAARWIDTIEEKSN